jgi:hypothetical protein
MRGLRLTTTVGVLVVAAVLTTAAAGQDGAGFKTSQPAMLACPSCGGDVVPLLTVGETLAGGYRFEAIPDGISLSTRGQGRADVWVNHETSLVPFPWGPNLSPPQPPTPANSQNDFDNSQVSHLILNQHSKGVLHGDFAIPSSANYQRFCSNFLAGAEHGFERELLLTNEEATDTVSRTANPPWPAPAGDPTAEQAGVVVAYDVKKKDYKSIYGMGRHNHENAVAVPGYGHPVVLSGDDTFSAPASQLYLYTAPDAQALWNDAYVPGATYSSSVQQLWAFKADDGTDADSIAENDYGDLVPGETATGSFIPVPENVAKGAQAGLETWSNENNVFQFIRVEDIAYDRNDSNIVYFADTGEPRAIENPASPQPAGRLMRGPSTAQGPYPNGRIFKLVLDEDDPTQVDEISVLINGDSGGYYTANPALWRTVFHQPDNIETTENSLLIQEDPGSHSNRAGETTAQVWLFDLDSPLSPSNPSVVARVVQSADETAIDVDPSTTPGLPGSWESSGIVDASSAFGPGWFLLTVQAHTLWVEKQEGTLGFPPDGPDFWFKREGGQLLAIRIPGA